MNKQLILIVEDNELQRGLIEKMAQTAGLHADLASDGREAIEALIRNPAYAAIMMDIGMLRMDGLECTRRIRDLELGTFKHVPIIAITARQGEAARKECLEAGMDDYLSKPFSQQQFQSMIAKWIKTVETADSQPGNIKRT